MSASPTATGPASVAVASAGQSPALAAPRMTNAVLAMLTGIALIVSFSESMLVPALPTIGAEYGAGPNEVAWVSAIYLLVAAASLPIAGKLGDLYGRKRILVIVMAIYSIAAFANGFSWSLESLIFFRGLQGIGTAMFALAFALIHDEMPAQRVPLATGLVSGMNSVGSTIALVVGAWVTQQFGWQVNYRFLGPAAIALTILIAFYARESPVRESGRVDYVGAGFFAVGIGLILAGLTQGPVYGWTSFATITFFAVGAALLVTFVILEFRIKFPLMDFRIPRAGDMMKTNILMFIAGGSLYLGFNVVIYYVQYGPPGFLLNVTDAALALLPGALLMIVFALLAGVLMRRYGIRLPELVALIALLAGFSLMLAFHSTLWELAIAFIPIVAGVAMLFNSVVNAIMVLSPAEKVGTQNATLEVFQEVGQAVTSAIVGAVLISYLHPVTGWPTGEAYALICGIGIGMAIFGVFVVSRLPRIVIPDTPAANRPGF